MLAKYMFGIFINGCGIYIYMYVCMYTYFVVLNNCKHVKKRPPKMAYTKMTKLHVRYENVVHNQY